MRHASLESDNERRFQPVHVMVEGFLRAVQSFTQPLVYAVEHPYAYTRTTYFDTEALDLLGTRGTGSAQRLRLREYAGAAAPGQPPVLTGPRFLEIKVTSGGRRTKCRCPVSGDEADALLTCAPLPHLSPASALLRQSTLDAVKPWVTAWYQRTTYVARHEEVRITLDEGLTYAHPPQPGGAVAPARLLRREPRPLLEVKWKGDAPSWLEQALRPLAHSETQASKFEEGMRALFGGTLP
ncbi:VTC domain-containing protein [Myxococcus sp. RHSTA-1-4]|uniref:VTC domain-containing protein n=1 Tax=Myxococcus sp. RHSTA-1-4 TaxID=2874601 RepID=UPI001CC1B45C|nr:VTC domain-containing protein [Myxococcus sp. RHSTA-1-4]